MTGDDLTAIERAYCTDNVGTHYENCHLVKLFHTGCCVAKLIAEVRRLRAELHRIRDMTGQVRHATAEGCVGCGCRLLTAEDALLAAMR